MVMSLSSKIKKFFFREEPKPSRPIRTEGTIDYEKDIGSTIIVDRNMTVIVELSKFNIPKGVACRVDLVLVRQDEDFSIDGHAVLKMVDGEADLGKLFVNKYCSLNSIRRIYMTDTDKILINLSNASVSENIGGYLRVLVYEL